MKLALRWLMIMFIAFNAQFFLRPGASAWPQEPHKNAKGSSLVNLAHLDSLKETVTMPDGKKYSIWAIYSEPVHPANPEANPYRHVADPDEGLSCVDDVARVAIVYLRHYGQTGDVSSLEKAREALDFVMYMETPDGLFCNFIFPGGRINKNGPTSRASLDFWTVRGFWALTEGYRIFKPIDPAYASNLKEHLDRTVSYLSCGNARSPLSRYGTYKNQGNMRIPAWLIKDSTDQSSLAAFALCTLYETDGGDRTKDMTEKLIEGIMAVQGHDPAEYPLCSFPSWLPQPHVWHAWGSRQMMALARAGRVFKRKDWIEAAENEANNLIIHLLSSKGLIFALGPAPIANPTQPYGCEVLTGGLVELFRATEKEIYGEMAGLMASWLFGNNSAHKPVYNSKRGLVFDGVDGMKRNNNSGAEATVSGLLALLAIDEVPQVKPFLDFREKMASAFITVEAESGKSESGSIARIISQGGPEGLYSNEAYVEMVQGSQLSLSFSIDRSDDYIPYIACLNRGRGTGTLTISIDGRAPPTVLTLDEKNGGSLCFIRLPSRALNPGEHKATIDFRVAASPCEVHVDALVLQRAMEERSFDSARGDHLTLYKSFDDKEKVLSPDSGGPLKKSTLVKIYDNKGTLAEKKLLKADASPRLSFHLPPFGYAVLEEIPSGSILHP
jgi:hypothetical protein